MDNFKWLFMNDLDITLICVIHNIFFYLFIYFKFWFVLSNKIQAVVENSSAAQISDTQCYFFLFGGHFEFFSYENKLDIFYIK